MECIDKQIILKLADNRMNVCEVGRVLFLHRNTVSYHISKIKKLTGLDPLNFYDLHKLVNSVKAGDV